MKFHLYLKLAAIAGISLVLLVALVRIGGLVQERRLARDAAVQDIARGSGLAQTLTGPVLAVPVVKTSRRWIPATPAGRRLEETVERRMLYVLPERLHVEAALAIEQRRRGIYEARLYRTQAQLRGHFVLPPKLEAPFEEVGEDDRISVAPAVLALGITDVRGIGTGLGARIGGQPAAFQSGASIDFLGGGVHAPLPAGLALTPGARIEFAIAVPLQGTGQFDIVPMGRETRVDLRSPWPHPSFTGQFLPASRSIDARGFEARWQTSFFATNLEELTSACARRAGCTSLDAPKLGVSLVDPVDQYLKSERAIKYSLLFIALTFAAFLLCEVLKGAGLHPMHYGLVGLALALFFLLLLSFAEHVGFAAAYALSATACVALLAFYLSHVLRSRARGLVFGAAFGALYAVLYGILAAEDYALLMGSLLLFAVLAAFMILTRGVDWGAAGAG